MWREKQCIEETFSRKSPAWTISAARQRNAFIKSTISDTYQSTTDLGLGIWPPLTSNMPVGALQPHTHDGPFLKEAWQKNAIV